MAEIPSASQEGEPARLPHRNRVCHQRVIERLLRIREKRRFGASSILLGIFIGSSEHRAEGREHLAVRIHHPAKREALEGKTPQAFGDDTAGMSVTLNIEVVRRKLFGDDE